jgi:hypothetical protein
MKPKLVKNGKHLLITVKLRVYVQIRHDGQQAQTCCSIKALYLYTAVVQKELLCITATSLEYMESGRQDKTCRDG